MSTEEETASISATNADKPLKISKNQQRKQKRYALMLERRKSKRKEEKAKQKQRRLDKLKNSEDQTLIARHILKYNRMENSSCRIRICMDCRYDSMMSDKDIRSLQKQIAFCYSANRRTLAPCQF
jgi:tRNA (guanine9-N1)-methyltransferase